MIVQNCGLVGVAPESVFREGGPFEGFLELEEGVGQPGQVLAGGFVSGVAIGQAVGVGSGLRSF